MLEAYERSKFEIDASHILLMWPSDYPSANDSARILKQIKDIKTKVKGNNFAQIAKQYSQDPSAKDNEGRLGYLTVFQTIYPFENAMYATPVGKVSEPVATRFGYHLVFVHDKREARGKIKTAHILIKSKDTDDANTQKIAADRANIIYKEISEGKITFEDAAKQYSEDNKTKFQNGELPELKGSEMMASYADAAFSLKKDGDVAPPTKTSIGWHIVKRISRTETPTFQQAETELKTMVARDSRSNVAQEKMIEDTKTSFGFKANANNKKEIFDVVQKSFQNNKFVTPTNDSYNKVLFTIGNLQVLQSDFIANFDKNHLRSNPDASKINTLENLYSNFENQKITQYREDNLEQIDLDFKNLVQEYRDGILLFELTNNEVWSKAVEDTAGLRTFHEANKEKYMWKERLDFSTYENISGEKNLKKLKSLVAKGKSSDAILAKLNKKENTVTVKHFLVEKGTDENVDTYIQVEMTSITDLLDNDKFNHTVIHGLRKPEPKKLSETKGYVISDYQDYLEKNWITNLKNKYKVEINQQVFESLIK
jgi:peptidyl-prolyl cis-trans isomerase SurA